MRIVLVLAVIALLAMLFGVFWALLLPSPYSVICAMITGGLIGHFGMTYSLKNGII